MIRASILGVLFASCVVKGQAQGQTCAQWAPTTSTSVGVISSFAPLPNGDVVAAGNSVTTVALWSGSAWTVMTPPLGNPGLLRVAPAPGGFLAGNVMGNVALWNGTAWSSLPSIPAALPWPYFQVNAYAALPNGDVFAGCFDLFGTAILWRWNGTAWGQMGLTGLGVAQGARVQAFVVLPNGDLIVGGTFAPTVASSRNIARWNGTSWSGLGAGLGVAPSGVPHSNIDSVKALAVLPNGDIVAGGRFSTSGLNVARWDGTGWSALATGLGPALTAHPGSVSSLAVLPNGDLVAGGYFTFAGATTVNNIARWDGSTWLSMASGVGPAGAEVDALAALPQGEVVVGGYFTDVGGIPATNFARYVSTCPATAVSHGSGCPSSGGANTLTATKLPWINATFDATATGLPATAIILTVTSVTPWPQGALPLTVVFPQAGPGCDVLVQPDVLGVLVTTTGMARSEFLLPLGSPLVGLPFYHQMVVIDVNGTGDWVAVSATNSLQLVAGDF